MYVCIIFIRNILMSRSIPIKAQRPPAQVASLWWRMRVTFEWNLLARRVITRGPYYPLIHSRQPKYIFKFMHVTSIEIIPQMVNTRQMRAAVAPIPQRERRIIIPIRLAAMLLGMYYVEILGYRHFLDLLRIRGGWQYTYILSVNSDAALCYCARARSYFYVGMHFIWSIEYILSYL